MNRENVRFKASRLQPSHLEVDYWVDLTADPSGSIIKYFNGTSWSSISSGSSSSDPELAQTVATIQQTVASMQSNVSQLQTDVTSAQSTATSAQSTATAAQSSVTTLQSTVTTLQSSISDMLTKTEAASTYQEKGDYLTEVPSEYITETELEAKGYQTETQVSTAIAALVNSAPETLDTLQELAAALGNDPYFATTVNTQLGQKLDTTTYEADKATFALKTELDDKQDTLVSGTNIKTVNGNSLLGSGDITISGGGDVDLSNYLAKDNTTEFTPTGDYNPATKKYVDDAIPNTSDFVTTSTLSSTLNDYAKTTDIPSVPTNVSELTNDAGYITSSALTGYATTSELGNYLTTSAAASTYATQESVSSKVSGTDVTAIEVVTELPASPDTNTLYIITAEG